jgi:hypothetical protein
MFNRPKPRRNTFASVLWQNNPFAALAGSLLQAYSQEQQQQARVQLQGLVLALLHTYHSRLACRANRQRYLQQLVAAFRRHGKMTSAAELLAILRAEQDDYLRRMELPAGVAVNEALRENVFVALVCMLNKIPLFLVRSDA